MFSRPVLKRTLLCTQSKPKTMRLRLGSQPLTLISAANDSIFNILEGMTARKSEINEPGCLIYPEKFKGELYFLFGTRWSRGHTCRESTYSSVRFFLRCSVGDGLVLRVKDELFWLHVQLVVSKCPLVYAKIIPARVKLSFLNEFCSQRRFVWTLCRQVTGIMFMTATKKISNVQQWSQEKYLVAKYVSF